LATEYTATIPDAGQYFFAVTAVDDAGLESDFSNEVNTEEDTGSLPPVANAGPDQTKAKGQVVTLNGSGSSDPDGSTITYQWVQTGGTAVTLSSSTAAQPTFTAPNVAQAGATLTFRFTVTDPQGL
jgi:large repetitive protein